jgi:hypothetical protein
VLCERTIHTRIEQFWAGSVKDIKKIPKHCVLTEEGCQNPRLRKQLLKLHSHKIRAIQNDSLLDDIARSRYCRYFEESVAKGFLDSESVFFVRWVKLLFNGNVNSQNYTYRCPYSPHADPKVPLHDFRIWVSCAVRARVFIPSGVKYVHVMRRSGVQ